MATTDCSSGQPAYGGSIPQPLYGGSFPVEVADSSTTQDGTTADSGDASAPTEPPETSMAATDAPTAADVPMAVAAYGGAFIVDSGAESDDGPSFVALYGGFAPTDGGIK